MSNPLAKYRIFKNVFHKETQDVEYEKYYDYIINMDKNIAHRFLTFYQYLHYYANIFETIYYYIDLIYKQEDVRLFLYIKQKLEWFEESYGQHYNVLDGSCGAYFLRKFGFMCRINLHGVLCDNRCDNSVCDKHIKLYNKNKLIITNLMSCTSLNILDIQNIVFEYYFDYTLN